MTQIYADSQLYLFTRTGMNKPKRFNAWTEKKLRMEEEAMERLAQRDEWTTGLEEIKEKSRNGESNGIWSGSRTEGNRRCSR